MTLFFAQIFLWLPDSVIDYYLDNIQNLIPPPLTIF